MSRWSTSLIALVLVASLGCATARPRFVKQRTPIDCAIASLAMADGTSYERVDHARARLGIRLDEVGGTPIPDVIAIAGYLGMHLVPREQVDLVQDEGIVIVVLRNEDGNEDLVSVHAVYVKSGQVYDPLDAAPVAWTEKFTHWRQLVIFLQKRHL